MYLIDKTYFLKSIAVPNIEEHNSIELVALNTSIDRYVRQFLQLTLNNVLFTDLDNNITDGVLSNSAPQKWLNLVNGCTYTKDGKDYTWQGLKYEQGLYKVSILAHFTYLNHYQSEINTPLGQIQINAKNGVNINPTEHLTTIWNEFITMYQGSDCNEPYSHFYNGTLFVDYYGASQSNSGYVSYLQFLTDNKVDYPGFNAGVLNYKNQLGI